VSTGDGEVTASSAYWWAMLPSLLAYCLIVC